jgi:HAD superfamily hydrolase (TIGR01509 family)
MPETKIKAVIFDFDGTLADTFSLVVSIALKLNDTLKLFKKEEINIEDFRNVSSSDFFNRLETPKYKLLYYFWKGRKLFGEKIDDVQVFPGIPAVLEKLKSMGIKLAVVSSNSKSNVRKFLVARNLNYFDVVDSPLFVFDKTRIIKKVVEQFNVEPEETLYVGDETRDIESAHSAGVKAVAVTWGYHFRELLVRYKPNYTIDTPQELLELV